MLLSVLKGVGGILLQAEDVKSLFFDLLDCRDQYQNRHDSKNLSTHEMQILCLLLEVHVTSCFAYMSILALIE
jgi:U3 small nucleolar RNA-associated protein 10